MQNIIEILKSNGIEVPEDKVATINKAVAENYKTVSEVEKKTSKLESERDSWKDRAETAEELDALLDKLSRGGINSLSEAELARLRQAREQMKQDRERR